MLSRLTQPVSLRSGSCAVTPNPQRREERSAALDDRLLGAGQSDIAVCLLAEAAYLPPGGRGRWQV